MDEVNPKIVRLSAMAKAENPALEIEVDGGIAADNIAVPVANGANVLVDEKEVPYTESNTALIRVDEAAWEEAPWATPGFPNTADGYAGWLSTVSGGDIQITITEIMTEAAVTNAIAAVGLGQVRIGGMICQVDNVNRILDRVAAYLA